MAIIKKLITKPSNKTQTHPKTTPTGTDNTGTADHQPGGYTPLIDKISIVIKPATEQDAYDIHSAFWTAIGYKSVFQGAGAEALKGYSRAQLIALKSTSIRPLIQYRKTKEKAEVIRLEFNPRKLGAYGLLELHAILLEIFPNGWKYVIEHGHITRMDVMIDLPDTRLDSFVLLPKQGLTVMEWAVNGTLESYRLGKSKGNQTVVYNVKKKRLAQGKLWPGASVVRVERRLKNLKPNKLDALPTFGNPFAEIVLCENLPGPPPDEIEKGKEWQWSMFGDSVKVRGLVPALALLPPDRKTKYRKHLELHKQPWWNPKAIWTQWPGMLDKLKIASAKSWT